MAVPADNRPDDGDAAPVPVHHVPTLVPRPRLRPLRGGRRAGSEDDYNVTLANDGFAPTAGPVTVSVDLPAGLAPYALSGPSGWACSLATVTCTTDSPIPAGAEVGITLQVTVAPDAPAWPRLSARRPGGEVPTPALDLDNDNDYNIVENGGVFSQPTYITQTSALMSHSTEGRAAWPTNPARVSGPLAPAGAPVFGPGFASELSLSEARIRKVNVVLDH